jgi:hypothetical protein
MIIDWTYGTTSHYQVGVFPGYPTNVNANTTPIVIAQGPFMTEAASVYVPGSEVNSVYSPGSEIGSVAP